MRKIDKTLIGIWSMPLPLIIATMALAYILSKSEDAIWPNVIVGFIVVYLACWVINCVLGIVSFIKDLLYDRWLEKHPEEQITTEKLAQDFENLAKALRESEKENKQ